MTKRHERMAEYFSWHRAATIWRAAWTICRELKIEERGAEPWPLPNVHLGVSVENQAAAVRVRDLLDTPAAVRFVSLEPLLNGIDLTRIEIPRSHGSYFLNAFTGQGIDHHGKPFTQFSGRLDWGIVGCESGPKRRPMAAEWAESLVEQFRTAGASCFVKQIIVADRVSGDIEAFPQHLRIRQYPTVPA